MALQRPVTDYFQRPPLSTFSNEPMYFNQPYKEIRMGHINRRFMILDIASGTQNEDQPALLRLLLENGASIYDWDVRGNTAMHLAIMMARPEQAWVVQTLVLLIQAGADPNQMNHAGHTAFDLACNTTPEFGSLRRDLLLQALMESGNDIQDDRLLASPRFTFLYTSMYHDTFSSKPSYNTMFDLREALLDKLSDDSNCRNITASRKLHEAAIDRVLASYTELRIPDPNVVFDETLDYLERISDAKKDIVRMTKLRLPNQSWMRFGTSLNWLQMTSQAQTVALVAFDWFRPVDLEDFFSTYVDNLIEQLENLSPHSSNDENIERLKDMLEHAVPSYRSATVRRVNCEELSHCSKSIFELHVEVERVRQASIVQTPLEFYRPELRFDKSCIPSGSSAFEESEVVEKPLPLVIKHKK